MKLSHKGFTGTYSKIDDHYYGKIANISDLVMFECTEESEIEKEFKFCVEDYIKTLEIISFAIGE